MDITFISDIVETDNTQESDITIKKHGLIKLPPCVSSSGNIHDEVENPIKVSALSLSWGTIALNTHVCRSIKVKNTSNKSLVLVSEIRGHAFQKINTQAINFKTIQSLDCHEITIIFSPKVTGAAIGVLSLCTTSNTPCYEIPLYAFGGSADIKIMDALRAPDSSLFLPVGCVNELPRPLEKTLNLYNKGPLQGFALIFAHSRTLSSHCDVDAFDIQPRQVLIAPYNSVEIRIVFNPNRRDLHKLKKNSKSVQMLCKLYVYYGDEANRQRLRRIVRDIPPSQHTQVLGLAWLGPRNVLDALWDSFPNEIELSELEAFEDDVKNAKDFISASCLHELTLTLNCDDLSDSADDMELFFDDTLYLHSYKVETNIR